LENTGLWFLESEKYVKWKTNAASFIWLNGIPGCGKTILSSAIIQDILQDCHDDLAKVAAYYYFAFNDTQKQLSEPMVKSLITQLSQQCVTIPAILESLFSSSLNGQRQPSLDALLQVLYQMIQDFPVLYIILDALDECSERDRLLEILEIMAGWKIKHLHLIVTSRSEEDINHSLRSFIGVDNTVCLQSILVDKDIFNYVHHRLSNDKTLRRWQKDLEMRREIQTVLMKKAHGMYVLLFAVLADSEYLIAQQVSVGCMSAGCTGQVLESFYVTKIARVPTKNTG
jgi:hypothetical protein